MRVCEGERGVIKQEKVSSRRESCACSAWVHVAMQRRGNCGYESHIDAIDLPFSELLFLHSTERFHEPWWIRNGPQFAHVVIDFLFLARSCRQRARRFFASKRHRDSGDRNWCSLYLHVYYLPGSKLVHVSRKYSSHMRKTQRYCIITGSRSSTAGVRYVRILARSFTLRSGEIVSSHVT